ncbi:hypothetical protein LJC45_00225 [Alistipes sp. OttesenSCG-928-B03]|nr:hypothetical protein [Alistipes sp. OttesenSCG-928-B03]
MKTFKSIFWLALGLLFVTACSNDETDQGLKLGKDETTINFELDASEVEMEAIQGTRTFTPGPYTSSGIKINAFKKSLTDNKFYFFKAIDVTKLTWNATTKKLTGTQIMPVGSYKFLISYGASQTGLTYPSFTTTTELNEAAAITYTYTNLGQGLPGELFLQTDKQSAGLTQYDFKISGETTNATVIEKLRRAVARIDVLVLSATKSGGVYTERAFSASDANKNILDNRAVELTFNINTLSKQMNVLGLPSNTQTQANTKVVLNYATTGFQNNNKVTIGSGTKTTVGVQTPTPYLTYDNVQASHIITKGAHIFGTYFFPFVTDANAATRKTTDLTLTMKGSKSASDVSTRTIAIPKVPLEQNKVTLIVIYVLGENGTSVFDTNVPFEVEVVTDWLGSHKVEVEVD